MKNIKIIEQAHLEGYEGAFYRYTTEDCKQSACGIMDNWYTAIAEDEDGNKYTLVWAITKPELFETGDEDCCDWDKPSEILMDGKPVLSDEINIIW